MYLPQKSEFMPAVFLKRERFVRDLENGQQGGYVPLDAIVVDFDRICNINLNARVADEQVESSPVLIQRDEEGNLQMLLGERRKAPLWGRQEKPVGGNWVPVAEVTWESAWY